MIKKCKDLNLQDIEKKIAAPVSEDSATKSKFKIIKYMSWMVV